MVVVGSLRFFQPLAPARRRFKWIELRGSALKGRCRKKPGPGRPCGRTLARRITAAREVFTGISVGWLDQIIDQA